MVLAKVVYWSKLMTIKQVIQSDIEESIKKSGISLIKPVEVTYTTDLNFGDYVSNWPLQVAKDLQQLPMEIAKKIEANLGKSEVYEPPKIADPGFINFRLSPTFLGKHLRLVLAEGERFGSSSIGKGKKAVVEYSSPNIAKPMHVGHLRNTNLGQAVVNILTFAGYQTISDNHIGDWGTQFGKLLWAYKTWGKELAAPSIKDLLDLYIKFHEVVKEDPSLEEAARAEFKKLEEGDKENRLLWEKFREASLKEFDRVYQDLGVKFDLEQGESFYEKHLPKVIDEALKLGVAKRDQDGSVLIPLEEKAMPPFLILKSDGATLYGTRDLATAKNRIEKLNADQVLYIVGAEQTLYFRQLFASLEKLGWGKGTKWAHVAYGLTRLPHGAMSTRSGELVTAQEIIDEAKRRAEKVITEKDTDKKPDQDLVKAVAIGAIKWNDLKISRESEVIFDWENIFSLEGNTGPYIQYSYARTQNILAKATPSEKIGNIDTGLLTEEEEVTILRQLVRFPEIVEESAENYAPHLICQHAFELAQSFSRFYEHIQVLSSPSGLKEARLSLVAAVGTALAASLRLLSISTPVRL